MLDFIQFCEMVHQFISFVCCLCWVCLCYLISSSAMMGCVFTCLLVFVIRHPILVTLIL